MEAEQLPPDNETTPKPYPANFPGYITEQGTTMVNTHELEALIHRCQEYKADIITLVSVFNGLQGLFSGKGGLMAIVPVVTKLLKDPAKMAELSAIVPVMDKYIQKPAENEH